MMAFIGVTGMLLDTRLDAEQHDFVETIRRSGDALLSLIKSRLRYAVAKLRRAVPQDFLQKTGT